MTRGCWTVLGLLMLVGLMGRTQAASATGCAETPAGALRAGLVPVGTGAGSDGMRGFRVESVRWDALLRQSWAVVASCEHPERPKLAMLTDLATGHGAGGVAPSAVALRVDAALPVVRAGDLVRLWRSDGLAHIEMVATAEQNGAVGARVRLRLMMPKDADGQVMPPQYLAGVVRGPADVEMVP